MLSALSLSFTSVSKIEILTIVQSKSSICLVKEKCVVQVNSFIFKICLIYKPVLVKVFTKSNKLFTNSNIVKSQH